LLIPTVISTLRVHKNIFFLVKPAIQIVVNGGPETIAHVYTNLVYGNMQVIVVADSGGAASLLIKACEIYDEHDNDLDGALGQTLTEEIQRTFLSYTGSLEIVLKQLLKCVMMKKQVCVLLSV